MEPPRLLAEPVTGYRAWNLSRALDGRGGWCLAGIGIGGAWNALEHGECRASCVVPTMRPRATPAVRHPVPAAVCTCGFYLLRAPAPSVRAVVRGSAVGWGRLVEHGLGWRCEWARPLRLEVDHRLVAELEPAVDPTDIAEELRRRYRCEVELVNTGFRPRRSWAVAVAAAVVAGAAPLLFLVPGWAL